MNQQEPHAGEKALPAQVRDLVRTLAFLALAIAAGGAVGWMLRAVLGGLGFTVG